MNEPHSTGRPAQSHAGQFGDNMKTAFLIAALLCAGFAHAHSGGTDKQGCHTDHKTGTRHCH